MSDARCSHLPDDPQCRCWGVWNGVAWIVERGERLVRFNRETATRRACMPGDQVRSPSTGASTRAARQRLARELKTETIDRFDVDAVGGHYEVCWCEKCGAIKRGDDPWQLPSNSSTVGG